MNADPNWLYSTIAQCSAALVAIVGGFLVSRVITLGQDKADLDRRRKDVVGRLVLAREAADGAHAERLWISVERFSRLHAPDVINGTLPTAEAMLDDWIPEGSSRKEMAEPAQNLAKLCDHIRQLDSLPDEPKALAARFHVPVSAVSEAVDAEDEARSDRDRSSSEFIVPYIPSASARQVEATYEAAAVARDAAEQSTSLDREAATSASVRQLEAEHELVSTELDRFASVPGLTRALRVLVYFSFAGIVLPLILEGLRPVPSHWLWRAIAIAGFASGLGALGWYLSAAVDDIAPGGAKWWRRGATKTRMKKDEGSA